MSCDLQKPYVLRIKRRIKHQTAGFLSFHFCEFVPKNTP